MVKNRGGPPLGKARGDPPLLFNACGDPGMFRHARDNPVCIKLIFILLTDLFRPEGRGMDN